MRVLSILCLSISLTSARYAARYAVLLSYCDGPDCFQAVSVGTKPPKFNYFTHFFVEDFSFSKSVPALGARGSLQLWLR